MQYTISCNLGEEFTSHASRLKTLPTLLKAELAISDIGYDEPCWKLKIVGVEESCIGVADKINRRAGKKPVKLAEDAVEHGMNPFDLPMATDAGNGQQD